MKKILLFLSLIILSLTISKKSYKGYKLISFKLQEQKEINRLRSLFFDDPLDVWTNDGELVYSNITENVVLVSPQQYFNLYYLEKSIKILNNDIQKDIDKENLSLTKPEDNFFDRYRRYDEIKTFVRNLIKEHPDMISEVENFGKTHENREIVCVIVSSPNNVDKKKNIFISALQHSREWISYNVPLYAIQKLIQDYKSGNPTVRKILDEVNIHIVPVVNPDGFEFSHTNQRLWRKNRRNLGNGIFGVDNNRNWPYKWGGPGASPNPRDETYMGPSPASEPETQSIIRYVNTRPFKFIGALDFHSYSELLLRPWQYSSSVSPDERKLFGFGEGLQNAIKQQHGKVYQNIRGSQLYVHSGAWVDYWYAEVGVPAFTIELRPDARSSYGFILPPQFIKPVVEENYPAILNFIQNCLNGN